MQVSIGSTIRNFVISDLEIGDFDECEIVSKLLRIRTLIDTNWGMDLTVSYEDDDRSDSDIIEELTSALFEFLDEEDEETEEERLNNPANDREYNGHESYRHWNACLHFGNCQTLYRMNVRANSWQDLKSECEEIGYTKTDDSIIMTDELYRAVWDMEHDDTNDLCIEDESDFTECYCDNTHENHGTVCTFCYTQGLRGVNQ